MIGLGWSKHRLEEKTQGIIAPTQNQSGDLEPDQQGRSRTHTEKKPHLEHSRFPQKSNKRSKKERSERERKKEMDFNFQGVITELIMSHLGASDKERKMLPLTFKPLNEETGALYSKNHRKGNKYKNA